MQQAFQTISFLPSMITFTIYDYQVVICDKIYTTNTR